MYFLIHKFSEWLNNNHINHQIIPNEEKILITIKYMNDKLYELLSNASITIDTGKEIDGILAIREECSLFNGEYIIIRPDYIAESLNILYPLFKNYIISKCNQESS